jgi:hypothetical protein
LGVGGRRGREEKEGGRRGREGGGWHDKEVFGLDSQKILQKTRSNKAI